MDDIKVKTGRYMMIGVIIFFLQVFQSCRTVFPNRGEHINCQGELVLPVMNPTQRSSFPGDKNELMRFILNNMNLPREKLKGSIRVSFITTKNGDICDFRVVSKSKEDIANEFIRIFSIMPKWNPAKNNGEIVDCYNYIKFKF